MYDAADVLFKDRLRQEFRFAVLNLHQTKVSIPRMSSGFIRFFDAVPKQPILQHAAIIQEKADAVRPISWAGEYFISRRVQNDPPGGIGIAFLPVFDDRIAVGKRITGNTAACKNIIPGWNDHVAVQIHVAAQTAAFRVSKDAQHPVRIRFPDMPQIRIRFGKHRAVNGGDAKAGKRILI